MAALRLSGRAVGILDKEQSINFIERVERSAGVAPGLEDRDGDSGKLAGRILPEGHRVNLSCLLHARAAVSDSVVVVLPILTAQQANARNALWECVCLVHGALEVT